jgi:hypothetical protein
MTAIPAECNTGPGPPLPLHPSSCSCPPLHTRTSRPVLRAALGLLPRERVGLRQARRGSADPLAPIHCLCPLLHLRRHRPPARLCCSQCSMQPAALCRRRCRPRLEAFCAAAHVPSQACSRAHPARQARAWRPYHTFLPNVCTASAIVAVRMHESIVKKMVRVR